MSTHSDRLQHPVGRNVEGEALDGLIVGGGPDRLRSGVDVVHRDVDDIVSVGG